MDPNKNEDYRVAKLKKKTQFKPTLLNPDTSHNRTAQQKT